MQSLLKIHAGAILVYCSLCVFASKSNSRRITHSPPLAQPHQRQRHRLRARAVRRCTATSPRRATCKHETAIREKQRLTQMHHHQQHQQQIQQQITPACPHAAPHAPCSNRCRSTPCIAAAQTEQLAAAAPDTRATLLGLVSRRTPVHDQHESGGTPQRHFDQRSCLLCPAAACGTPQTSSSRVL
jgi:hypothetical protein